tara:strand:- start:66 stop:296 length:231 start_codon:yes stop_codon:yes gene_type:complete
MYSIQLTDYGQVEPNDLIIIKLANGKVEPKRVDDVLEKGTEYEEVLLKSNNKAYFITKNLLTDASWVKSVLIIKAK